MTPDAIEAVMKAFFGDAAVSARSVDDQPSSPLGGKASLSRRLIAAECEEAFADLN